MIGIVLLAAGHGTRMNSKTQKILHEVGGKPMLLHIFEAAEAVADLPPVVVIGPGGDGVRALLGDRATYVVQDEQLGTGHATQVTQDALQGKASQVIVTYGDMPLLRQETLVQLANAQQEADVAISMLSVRGEASSSFGRVVRGENGRVSEIVEVAEAKQRPNRAELLAITELNVGVYCFDGDWLWASIGDLPLRQARSGVEYYLTDMVEIAAAQKRSVSAFIAEDGDECLGAGTRQELVAVEQAFRQRAINHWLANGVTFVDPASTFIDQDVIIGQDTVIWPNSYLQGKTAVGEDCIIGPNVILRDATVGAGCRVEQAVLDGVTVVGGTIVLPFSHLKSE